MTKVIGTRSRSFRAAQLGVQNEGEFIGRAEARGALHRADHDRARVGAERLERVMRLLGVIDVADRLRVAVRAEPGDLVEGEFRAGGDHEVVVGNELAVVRARCGFSCGCTRCAPSVQERMPLRFA